MSVVCDPAVWGGGITVASVIRTRCGIPTRKPAAMVCSDEGAQKTADQAEIDDKETHPVGIGERCKLLAVCISRV